MQQVIDGVVLNYTFTVGYRNLIKNIDIPEVDLSDYYTKTEIDSKIGDIETALDSIIAIQESYLGGAE